MKVSVSEGRNLNPVPDCENQVSSVNVRQDLRGPGSISSLNFESKVKIYP